MSLNVTETYPKLSQKRKRELGDVGITRLKPSRTPRASGDTNAASVVVVAHSDRVARYSERLLWSSQWEMARLITTGTFDYDCFSDAALEHLCTFRTSREAVSEVLKLANKDNTGFKLEAKFLHYFNEEKNAKCPWKELDKEDASLHEDPYGSLGCCNKGGRDPDWYGGQVNFSAKLLYSELPGEQFKMTLERPTLGASNRFTRRYGSRRFIRVRFDKSDMLYKHGSNALEYFKHPFIICGRVFRAFYFKEHVTLIDTNEQFEDGRILAADPGKNLFLDILAFHNPLELNKGQSMVKWTARMALGFSNTTPGIQLEPTNIRLIDDIICPAFDGLGKIPSEMQMSDGCGFANQLVMRSLQVKHRWPERYTAVQVRLGGMKGIIMEISDRPDDDPKVPIVWVRPSQVKIKHSPFRMSTCLLPPESDPGNLIIDVVRPARLTSPARLSVETIINMSENGVPSSVFVNLMRSGMHKLVDMFVNWDQPGGLYLLWDSLRREFGVIPSRLAREAAGAARARGYIREDRKDDSEQDDWSSEDPLQGRSTAWADDPVSGCPSSLVETIMQLLDAGFTPENCAVLSAKLKVQGTESLDKYCSDYHLPVEMSCSAVIIPDPYDVLGPGEIHIKSSHRNLVDQEGNYTDVIIGDVLVTRHPCKLPTDVQKVKAVFHEKLRNCLDVIVVSTKSYEYNGKPLNRHLASMTAGGDYDGDTWEVYWQPDVVEPFRNADPSYATVPDGISKCLQKSKESVQEFLARIPMNASDETKILALQEYLLAGLRNASQVGRYSTFWTNALYKHGYSSDDAVFLAHLFNTVLDGSKTGASVDKRIFSEHMAKYGKRGPEWAETEVQRNSCRNDIHLKRGAGLPSFVMDELFTIGHKEEKEKQAKRLIDAFVRPVIFSEELAAPWKDAVKRAAQFSETHGCDIMQEDLEKIKAHVEYVYQRSKDTLGSFYEKRSSGSQMSMNGKTASFTTLPIEVRQDTFRKLSMEFCSGPEVESYDRHTLERLRASYAYIYDYERNAHKIASKRWSRFPWDVAFRALCEINANAGALSRTVTQGFYSKMSVDRAFVKSLTKE